MRLGCRRWAAASARAGAASASTGEMATRRAAAAGCWRAPPLVFSSGGSARTCVDRRLARGWGSCLAVRMLGRRGWPGSWVAHVTGSANNPCGSAAWAASGGSWLLRMGTSRVGCGCVRAGCAGLRRARQASRHVVPVSCSWGGPLWRSWAVLRTSTLAAPLAGAVARRRPRLGRRRRRPPARRLLHEVHPRRCALCWGAGRRAAAGGEPRPLPRSPGAPTQQGGGGPWGPPRCPLAGGSGSGAPPRGHTAHPPATSGGRKLRRPGECSRCGWRAGVRGRPAAAGRRRRRPTRSSPSLLAQRTAPHCSWS